jgi:ParB-like chromosome segregation protein Spo0J
MNLVQEIKIEELNPAPYNPRVELEPGMPEWEKLERSIKEFGNTEPIVWNKRTRNVVGGHQRLAVLKSLGYKTVPCSVVDLDEHDEKLLNVALNKIKGRWDFDKLEKMLRDFDYEVASVTGFTPEEIAVLLADNDDLEFNTDDYGDWDDDPEEQVLGGSWVVTLVFENNSAAKAWADNNGYEGQVKEGTGTTVIRVEEE